MEGLFLLIVIGFISYLAVNTSSKATSSSKRNLAAKASHDSDVPEYLKNKWEREDQPSKQSGGVRTVKTVASAQNLWRTSKNVGEGTKRQSRNAQNRNSAQTKMFLQSGNGQPIDKNNDRRADWGKRGHLGGGWLQPILVSLIATATLAGLFAAL